MTCRSTMRKAGFAAWCCMIGVCSTAPTSRHPENGDGRFNNPEFYADFPDPDRIRVTNDFYMVSTTFADSPGITVLHLKDLVNREIISHCAMKLDWSNTENMIGGPADRQGFWASSIHCCSGTFYPVAN